MKFFEAAKTLGAMTNSYLNVEMRPASLQGLHDAVHPTCLYYRYINELVERFKPLDVIEIGTYVGTSAAHFAANNRMYIHSIDKLDMWIYGSVTTVDIQPDAKKQVDALGYQNITALTGDSLQVVEKLQDRRFDVLYIDGLHNFSQAYREYFHYRKLVRDGGLIIIDDVNLEMDGDEMNVLWDAIREPKARLDHLHPNTGFGIVEKDNRVHPEEPVAAMDRAAPIIRSRSK